MGGQKSSVWCKICGITSVRDAVAAADAGADALGMNFFPRSPRFIDSESAAEIATQTNALSVGLFVDPTEREVLGVLDQVALDMLQFHGDEGADFCAAFDLPYLKAIRMQAGIDFRQVAQAHAEAWGLLLDTYMEGTPGGTGETFDWSLWPSGHESGHETRLILAGGLNPDTVANAVLTMRPFGVDVCGGVEKAKGVKDEKLVRSFIEEARSV